MDLEEVEQTDCCKETAETSKHSKDGASASADLNQQLAHDPLQQAETEIMAGHIDIDPGLVQNADQLGSHFKLKRIELNAEFESFLELKDAIERYQRENFVQLIVKDSKLLRAESTKKVIPKVYHLVNQELMYHSITYCCKCHGELKQKPNTRVKNVGAKRLNCPMYFRLRLTSDLQKLVIFDIDETHNHGIDPNTCQMAPRQQVYALSRMRQGKPEPEPKEEAAWRPVKQELGDVVDPGSRDVGALISTAIKDVTDTEFEPCIKIPRTSGEQEDLGEETEQDQEPPNPNRPESPLDSESSLSDSDDGEMSVQRRLLPFPVRLIGSAVQSCPELVEASRQLIELQKSKLALEKQKLLLQTKNLELCNLKLELEVKKLERTLASDMAEGEQGQDTTIYLQAS